MSDRHIHRPKSQWATDGPLVNLIVGCQQWTTVYQLVTPPENHHCWHSTVGHWWATSKPYCWLPTVGHCLSAGHATREPPLMAPNSGPLVDHQSTLSATEGGPIEKLIIGCRQWATEGPSENRIVGYQRWTTAYQPVTPTAGHRLQPTSDRQLCRQWASGGPTKSCYLGTLLVMVCLMWTLP